MSIIIDALGRVQTDLDHKNQMDDRSEAFSTLDEARPPSSSPDKRSKKPFVIIFFVVVVLAIYALFFLANNFSINELIEKKAFDVNTKIEDTSPTSHTTEQEFEEFDTTLESAFFDSTEEVRHSETEPLNHVVNISPPTLKEPDLPKIEKTEPALAEVQESPPLPKIVDKPQKIRVTPLPIEKPIPLISLPEPAIKKTPPDWLSAGKAIFHREGLAQALPTWNNGFLSLAPKTPIISIMINHVPKLATKTLLALHENQINAFSVSGLFRGKIAYFTIALYADDPQKTANLIEQITSITKSIPFKSTQDFIHKRVIALFQNESHPKKTNNIIKKMSHEERLRIGKELVLDGEYKKSIKILRPVLFNKKENWEILFWIGSAKLGLGLYNEADDYFKKALTLNLKIPQLWIQRAIIAQEKNEHRRALTFLQKAQALAPNSPEILLNIAYSNDALGDQNGAVFAYRDFLSLTRNNSQFFQQRQAVHARLEEMGFN